DVSRERKEKMKSDKVLVAVVVLLVFGSSAFAQNDPTLDTGLKPYASYHGGYLDSVNLSNGNLTVHIPLASYPQRGGLGYSPRVIYNNKGWSVIPNCNRTTGICSPYWVWRGDGVKADVSSENAFTVTWQPAAPGSLALMFNAGTADGSSHLLASN